MSFKLNLDLNFRWPVCYLPHKYASCSLTFVSIHLTCSCLEHIRPFNSTHKTYLRFPPDETNTHYRLLSFSRSFVRLVQFAFLNGTFDELLLIGHCLNKVFVSMWFILQWNIYSRIVVTLQRLMDYLKFTRHASYNSRDLTISLCCSNAQPLINYSKVCVCVCVVAALFRTHCSFSRAYCVSCNELPIAL